MTWVPLHVHSQFSILDSTASIKAIAAKSAEYNMPAVALTDSGNMYGVVDFFKACKAQQLKPIMGCELRMAPHSRLLKKRTPGTPNSFPIVLLAMNPEGYQNLCRLSSIGYLEGFYYFPRIDKEVLEKNSGGLICLSGPLNGPLSYYASNDDDTLFQAELEWYLRVFKERFFLEFQRHPMSQEFIEEDGMDRESWLLQKHRDTIARQNKVIEKLLAVSGEKGIRYVATNDTHYIRREDWRAHEILLNVQSGEPCEIWERDSFGNPKVRTLNPKRKVYSSHEHYFKSAEEMRALFSDLPEALSTTLEIAESIDCELDFETKFYPVYVPPAQDPSATKEEKAKGVEQYLLHLCKEGIPSRYDAEKLEHVRKQYPDRDPLDVVEERLDYEFTTLASKGMCDYMLIVYDFIAWAKRNQIPVGPGRGSAAGSIVAYLIGITDIEPLRFNLFFERFINPERISYPDIDVDICMERRSDVIDYTVNTYGKDKVAQIITFGKMKAKMAIKDVGRVLSVPLAKVNAIAKLVPEDPNMTLEKALEIDPELGRTCETDEETKRVIDMAKATEGSIRNTSIHAAGMIISAAPITEHIPVCIAKDSEMVVTQYAMKPVESVGMLKIDFLGLKTLTSIQKAVDAVARSGKRIDWTNLSLEDKATFNLLNQGHTLGVFQLESGGMKELAKQLHIDHFEEIIAVGALYRPGPMDMIPSFINRKHGKEPIEFDHPLMKEILQETYGVMVYQEQVMQIASKLAGYSLGEGDVLRRAMGKKDREEMARQREKFVDGAREKGIDPQIAVNIFDKIEKFASYGFNKSHATAYAYLSYVTAYMKANHPREWMAALMTCDKDDLTKVAKFIRECRSMKIAILPPDVNEAGIEFMATPSGIRFAMSGIKGVGEAVVEAIIDEREKKGPYESLYDFIKRVDTKRVSKKNIELLIDAGCFGFTDWTMEQMHASVEAMYDRASREQKEASQGVMNLFSLLEEKGDAPFQAPPKVPASIGILQKLQREKELLGFYLSGHPMESYKKVIARLSCAPLNEIENFPHDTVQRFAFLIETVQLRISSKSQKKFAILIIGDGLERYELPIWPEMYEEKSQLLVENQLLYGVLQIDKREGSLRLQCRYLEDLTVVSEEKIQECDDAYDRAKSQVRQGSFRKKAVAKKAKEEPQPKKQRLNLKIDIEKVRLSEILDLKNTFRSNPGNTTVSIDFFSFNKKVGALSVDAKWSVRYHDEAAKKISALPYILSAELV